MSRSLSLKINVWDGEMVELDLLFIDISPQLFLFDRFDLTSLSVLDAEQWKTWSLTRFKINLKRIIMILNGVLTLNYHHDFLNHLISSDSKQQNYGSIQLAAPTVYC